jgi:eukaryotic-like serine/threonine-protein kinase
MGEYESWGLDEGDELAPGRTVVKPIGGGNRYEVFLVWDERLFSLAVAKVLRPDQADDERALRDLGEEARVLERLAHPVLIRSFGATLEGERPQVLIEHLEGPSLRRLLKRGGPLELDQLLPLALSVAGALAYMHGEGYVHLDVKPDNIVMGVPPRLIDLSIARDFERAGRSRGPIGTDAYMAPEQTGAEGSGPMGAPADVWGLGATLHHCISGERPFPRERGAGESEDPAIRFPQLHAEASALPDYVPAALAELIAATLEPDPAARPTATELAERLEPIVAEAPSRLVFSRRGFHAR